MVNIIFYEKPGCINGEKQKNILLRAGHTLECRNILTFPWTRSLLEPFLGQRSPELFMNHTAPRVKSGEIVPADLERDAAIDLMLADPIFIKRPLIEVDGLLVQGFTSPELKPYLGDWDGLDDVVTCPNLKTLSCDER